MIKLFCSGLQTSSEQSAAYNPVILNTSLLDYRRRFVVGSKMEFHEIAAIFPLMAEAEFDQLKADIAQNGLIEPVWTYQGLILDGRNRYLACKDLGVDPRYQEYGGNDPQSFVISKNLHRRHLNETQRAVVASKLANMPKHRPDNKSANLPTYISQPEAAKKLNVSERTVRSVKQVEREAPELMPKLESGEMTAGEASRIIRRKDRIESTPVIPDGKYNVIYADPPWKYDFGFDIHGAADRHYHTMSIQELCELPIIDLTEDNAVLFMWVTSPKLFDAHKIITAWGFEYKTSFIWDKVKHVMGHYNSVRHEILLVCIRGSFPKQSKTLHDSVITIERSDEHSEKPEYFRGLIETMYPKSKKIELFARQKVDGWETWGNEL